MSTNKRVSAPIRMSPEMLEKVVEASRLTGISQADVMRLCLAIGLEDLRKVGFDLAKVISDAAHAENRHVRPLLNVADDETDYGSAGNGA